MTVTGNMENCGNAHDAPRWSTAQRRRRGSGNAQKIKTMYCRVGASPRQYMVDIFLDRNTRLFVAAIMGVRVESDTFEHCKDAVMSLWLDTMSKLEWRKIIIVNIDDWMPIQSQHISQAESVSFKYVVKDIAKVSDEIGHIERMFSPVPPHKPAYAKCHIVSIRLNRGMFVLDWTQQTEDACQKIVTALVAVKSRINDILMSDNIPAALAGGVQKLLPDTESEGVK